MASDPTKPLLRLIPQQQQDRPVGPPRNIPQPRPFPQDRQFGEFAPKFERLARVLQQDPTGLQLTADPSGLAPERLLVFEVRGSIGAFASAVRNVPGLELVDEDELAEDDDKAPVAYLMVPDVRALRQLESLWRRWTEQRLAHGEGAWAKVFTLLRDLRPWGPSDRVSAEEANILAEEIEGLRDDETVRVEIELVFRASDQRSADQEEAVRSAVVAVGGRIITRSRIAEIAYHALLVELPVRAVRAIADRLPLGLADLEPIRNIRPQSVASSVDVSEEAGAAGPQPVIELGSPILALLDGVPVAAHRLLNAHLSIDDQFGLEPGTAVAGRVHGTAMASLLIHGDRNRAEQALPRRIHVVPVLGAGERFPENLLIVDMIYNAVMRMRDGAGATSPGVIIVNLSLGNPRRPFHGQLSPWAKLLDRMAYRYGLLFVVSAGNCTSPIAIPAYAHHGAYEDASTQERSVETLRAVAAVAGERRLFSPSETVNGLTVGACNFDTVSAADRATARSNVDPFGELAMANPSSALGPGFARSVKPDVLFPGCREHLAFVGSNPHLRVRPAGPARFAGLKVAAPPVAGGENIERFTNGTSAAAALASRTCHRIHDALESAYGEAFLRLPHLQRAVLLKALLAHNARWPNGAAALIRGVMGPADNRQHVRQKDNIRRFLGFGVVEAEDAVACSADRATFWATGNLQRTSRAVIAVPIPLAMAGQARAHSLSATLAWFTPTSPQRQSYRSVRLKIIEPSGLGLLRVSIHSDQPDTNQTGKGTIFSRCWNGDRAPVVGPLSTIELIVQREPDQGPPIDESVPFGLAVTLTMPGVIEIYEQVRQRLGIQPRVNA